MEDREREAAVRDEQLHSFGCHITSLKWIKTGLEWTEQRSGPHSASSKSCAHGRDHWLIMEFFSENQGSYNPATGNGF